MRPEFIRVLPAEVEQYGSHGAILVAHIRFRTQTDRWWRASLTQMADETGLSVRGVRTAIEALGNAVAATDPKPDKHQSRSWRVVVDDNSADLPVVEIDTHADQPVVEIDRQSVETDTVACRNRHSTVSKSTTPLPIRELENGENARATGEQIEQPTAHTSQQTTPPKINLSVTDDPPPDGGRVGRYKKQYRALCASVPAEPPSATCKVHDSWDGPACVECGADRRAYESWVNQGWSFIDNAGRIADQIERHDLEAYLAIRNECKRRVATLCGRGERRPA